MLYYFRNFPLLMNITAFHPGIRIYIRATRFQPIRERYLPPQDASICPSIFPGIPTLFFYNIFGQERSQFGQVPVFSCEKAPKCVLKQSRETRRACSQFTLILLNTEKRHNILSFLIYISFKICLHRRFYLLSKTESHCHIVCDVSGPVYFVLQTTIVNH